MIWVMMGPWHPFLTSRLPLAGRSIMQSGVPVDHHFLHDDDKAIDVSCKGT